MRRLFFVPFVFVAACDPAPGLFETCGCLPNAELCMVWPADPALMVGNFDDLDEFQAARVAEVEATGFCQPLPAECPGAEFSEDCANTLPRLCPLNSTTGSLSNGSGEGWLLHCNSFRSESDPDP